MCTFFFRLYEANLSGPLPGVQCQCSRFISLLSGRILKSKRWGNTYTQVWYWLSNYWSTHTVQDQGLFQRAISRTSSHCPRASNSLHYCRTSYLVRIYAENRPSDDFFFIKLECHAARACSTSPSMSIGQAIHMHLVVNFWFGDLFSHLELRV